MNIIQKIIDFPMQRNIHKCCTVWSKHKMLSLTNLQRRCVHRSSLSQARNVNEEDSQPVKYTASAAGKFRARSSLQDESQRLWYEPYVVSASLGIFLLYFLILREENDLDENMFMPLHERISGLEEVQLKSVIEHSKDPGEVANAKIRLKEIEK